MLISNGRGVYMKRNSVDVHLLIWGFKLVCNKEYGEVEAEKNNNKRSHAIQVSITLYWQAHLDKKDKSKEDRGICWCCYQYNILKHFLDRYLRAIYPKISNNMHKYLNISISWYLQWRRLRLAGHLDPVSYHGTIACSPLIWRWSTDQPSGVDQV